MCVVCVWMKIKNHLYNLYLSQFAVILVRQPLHGGKKMEKKSISSGLLHTFQFDITKIAEVLGERSVLFCRIDGDSCKSLQTEGML